MSRPAENPDRPADVHWVRGRRRRRTTSSSRDVIARTPHRRPQAGHAKPAASAAHDGSPMSNIQQVGDTVLANVERVIVGKHHEVRLALVALLCRGHLLIEDVPGTGKTCWPRRSPAASAAASGGSSSRRTSCRPTSPASRSTTRRPRSSSSGPGPIMSQVVLADEINRATPKTQSSASSSAWRSDRRRSTASPTRCPTRSWSSRRRTRSSTRAPSPCPRPSSTGSCSASGSATRSSLDEIVILDEQKRTHPLEDLSEVCSVDELRGMQADVREVYVDPAVSDYIVRLVSSTRTHPDVYLGASPRGSIALYRATPGARRADGPRLRHPRRRQGRSPSPRSRIA